MTRSPAPHFSTKQRILDVAEALFAEHGFAGTSLRLVTSQAEVNLAAVNYHFGSKDNLITEVFRHRMDAMSQARLERLEHARKVPNVVLEEVLRAFIEPALALSLDRDG
ncbi:MAG: TetR/AcrR family transcriptional regulator, partial [Lysobacteraceae bacterium]